MIAVLAYSARPGTLFVHVNSPWTSVAIGSDSHASKEFSAGESPKLWPLIYGPYKVKVTFADGKVAWLGYFHFDAGVRKRADLTIERLPDGESVRLIRAYNGSNEIEGSRKMSESSESSPFRLEGPA